MRHFLIDTDTASDDAVALLMALREPAIQVEAITIVAGNCPLHTCLKNALVTIEVAGTYYPPVFIGMGKPLMRKLYTSEFVHGDDGMGNMDLHDPSLKPQTTHAVDMIIEMARKFPGELEVVTLGPLTNLAMAILREPALPELIKMVYVMGGAGFGPGNITPIAEFNFYVDAEAVHVFLTSELNKTIVGWDVCYTETFIDQYDIDKLNGLGKIGQFAVRCNASLIEFNKNWGKDGFDLPDPSTIAVALYPDIVTESGEYYTYIDYQSHQGYGQFVIDQYGLLNQAHNATIVSKIDAVEFKQRIFKLLS